MNKEVFTLISSFSGENDILTWYPLENNKLSWQNSIEKKEVFFNYPLEALCFLINKNKEEVENVIFLNT